VPTTEPRPLIFDTDGGVDDCAALWWALTDPSIRLIAVTTTSGAAPARLAATSVLKVLAAAGRLDIPVAVGDPGTLGPAPLLQPVAFIHGHDGQGNADHHLPAQASPAAEPAVALLHRLIDARPGEISVVATAPLTNLARVLAEDPSWAGRVAMLVWADPRMLLDGPELPLAVVTTEGPAWGATIADRRAPFFARIAGSQQAQPPGFAPWRIALEVDVDRFRTHFRHLTGA
jgi:purine nucleosidase